MQPIERLLTHLNQTLPVVDRAREIRWSVHGEAKIRLREGSAQGDARYALFCLCEAADNLLDAEADNVGK